MARAKIATNSDFRQHNYLSLYINIYIYTYIYILCIYIYIYMYTLHNIAHDSCGVFGFGLMALARTTSHHAADSPPLPSHPPFDCPRSSKTNKRMNCTRMQMVNHDFMQDAIQINLGWAFAKRFWLRANMFSICSLFFQFFIGMQCFSFKIKVFWK